MRRAFTQYKGDAGEYLVRQRYIMLGYKCTKEKPNNKGFDFIARKKLVNGVIEEIKIEVKAGTHRLSKPQQEMKEVTEREGKIYKHIIVKVPEIYFGDMMRKLWPDGFR
jgi:hypothetical protein